MEKLVAILSFTAAVFTMSGCAQLAPLISGEVLLDSSLVEKTIEDGVFEQGGFYVTVECPDPMSGQVGDVRQCLVSDEFGQNTFADVTIQNRQGFMTWQLRD
jgi:hypothetical protein